VSIRKTVFITSLAFAVMHMNMYQPISAFFAGIIFCLVLYYTKSIIAPIISHFIINFLNLTLRLPIFSVDVIIYEVSSVDPNFDSDYLITLVLILYICVVVVFGASLYGIFDFFKKHNIKRNRNLALLKPSILATVNDVPVGTPFDAPADTAISNKEPVEDPKERLFANLAKIDNTAADNLLSKSNLITKKDKRRMYNKLTENPDGTPKEQTQNQDSNAPKEKVFTLSLALTFAISIAFIVVFQVIPILGRSEFDQTAFDAAAIVQANKETLTREMLIEDVEYMIAHIQ